MLTKFMCCIFVTKKYIK